jgi:integrase/recombinase XerC
MVQRGLSPATIGRRLSALRSMVKVARQIGRITWTLEVEQPKSVPYRDTRGPGLDGWRRIVAAVRSRALEGSWAAKRDLAIIRLLHDLGLRRGEVSGLDVEDVSWEPAPGAVWIVGKGQSEKIKVTLNLAARAALAEWLLLRGDEPGPLFSRLDRAREGGCTRLTGASIWRLVRRWGRVCKVTHGARPHGLRHQGITRALDLSGGDVRKVQRFSRHAKLETLLRYDDARRDDAGDIARQLGEDS